MAQVAEYSLSTASGEAASTLSYNSGNGSHPAEEEPEQQQPPPPPGKKKRNQPGMPDPDAEVVALSPTSLLATNRFLCEICGKGFQRDQNLQLHRRGHNLPWKLRQRGPKDSVRKRVYVCPEPSCVHHDPRRALGDLTGIKKHFCRKHGEKNWKCDRCSKKYAVQSDWKAHLKTCGTRQYQCDCGTIFSRRDSFVTHRAFCDALVQESAKVQNSSAGSPAPETAGGSPPATSSAILSPVLSTSQNSEMHEGIIGAMTSSTTCIPSSTSECNIDVVNKNIVLDNTMFASLAELTQSISQPQTSFPNTATSLPDSDLSALYSIEPPRTLSRSPLYRLPTSTTSPVPHPPISATALLQKATQMGVSSSGSSLLCGFTLGVASSSPIPSHSKHGEVVKPENVNPVPNGLGLGLLSNQGFGESSQIVGDPSGFFGSKPMTLDFLGLGIGPGSSSRGVALSGYLGSIGSPLDVSVAFGEGTSSPSQSSWDDQDTEKKSKETVI